MSPVDAPPRRRHEELLAVMIGNMSYELTANEWKGGWSHLPRWAHFAELRYHVTKLRLATLIGDPLRIVEYASDVANHAMFIADTEKALLEPVSMKRRGEAKVAGRLPPLVRVVSLALHPAALLIKLRYRLWGGGYK